MILINYILTEIVLQGILALLITLLKITNRYSNHGALSASTEDKSIDISGFNQS